MIFISLCILIYIDLLGKLWWNLGDRYVGEVVDFTTDRPNAHLRVSLWPR